MKAVKWIGLFALLTTTACSSLRETRMEAAADYGAAKHIYVVPSPTPLLAGPDTVRTTTPDGSTVFVCPDGSVRDSSRVPAGSKRACL